MAKRKAAPPGNFFILSSITHLCQKGKSSQPEIEFSQFGPFPYRNHTSFLPFCQEIGSVSDGIHQKGEFWGKKLGDFIKSVSKAPWFFPKKKKAEVKSDLDLSIRQQTGSIPVDYFQQTKPSLSVVPSRSSPDFRSWPQRVDSATLVT